jgi:CPA2 family monovalent cation:H+ antiporter-2
MRAQLHSALGARENQDLRQLLQEEQSDWQLQAEEYVLPEFSASAGRRVGDLALRKRFGCSIASIERHGVVIANPGADAMLFPLDKLLLLGSSEQIDKAMAELGAAQIHPTAQDIEEFSLETVRVAAQSPRAGKTLAELDPFRNTGVQVAGIQRGHQRILTPTGSDQLEAGDELLVLGTAKQIRDFEDWLNESLVT